MHTPNHSAEISFLLPNHPTQQPLFQAPFNGQGIYLTIEVDDVDLIYNQLKSKGIAIKIEFRDEPWGETTICPKANIGNKIPNIYFILFIFNILYFKKMNENFHRFIADKIKVSR